jgi:micrococcal nuclease
MKIKKKTLVAILIIGASLSLAAETNGVHSTTGEYKYQVDKKYKVVSVIDGDTIKVRLNNSIDKVRFSHINCPEKGEPYYKEAKEFVKSYIQGKTVFIKTNGRDKYSRLLGEVFYKGENINLLLVSNGLAKHYKRFSSDKRYSRVEKRAKEKGVGMWNKKNAFR